ncbi:MAG: CDP-glucose 4,6-dehydratase [Sulfuricaulis sp.]
MEQWQGSVEGMVIDTGFWKGKAVFITGHTGFKGSWLSLWLQSMGATVTGFSLPPPTDPSLFVVARVHQGMESINGDIRDLEQLQTAMQRCKPEIVVHMAAQSLVRYSYQDPIDTYSTNVMGTVNVLEAVRRVGSVKAVINVTSDKCYENREWVWGYRENEPMGGHDPYSSSKGCAELVTSAYRRSFFNTDDYASHGVALASVRAGNVIGGGDWARDRLIPDIIRAIEKRIPVLIRSPDAIRPWQHVLEPLSGYLLLAERLYREGVKYAEGWNFGPADTDAQPVRWIVQKLCDAWGDGASWKPDTQTGPHEAHYLKLDCSKARISLGWKPVWSLQQAIAKIVAWQKAASGNGNMRTLTLSQIADYQMLDQEVN